MKDKPDHSRTSETKLLKASEVIRRLRIAKSTFYDYLKKGWLPAPVAIGPRTKRWVESDIDDLLRRRPQSG